MRKIGQFINEMDMLLGKVAFVPAPQQGGQGDPSQQQQQGGQDPSQQQQGGGGDPMQQLMAQLPPEMAQQIQQLPPEQQQQALQQVMQQMQGGQGGGDPSQGGQPQGGAGGGDPSQQGQQGNPGSATNQDGTANTNGHIQAENQLDNTKVTLSVRELMDITSKGGASEALFKVKQLAGQHNQKMQSQQQKMQMEQQQAQMDQQAASQGMQSGGIYSQAPDMSGAPSGGGQSQPAPQGGGGGM